MLFKSTSEFLIMGSHEEPLIKHLVKVCGGYKYALCEPEVSNDGSCSFLWQDNNTAKTTFYSRANWSISSIRDTNIINHSRMKEI